MPAPRRVSISIDPATAADKVKAAREASYTGEKGQMRSLILGPLPPSEGPPWRPRRSQNHGKQTNVLGPIRPATKHSVTVN